MLRSRMNQFVATYFNNGTPGYLSRPAQLSSGGSVTTVATIDNRELKNSDGILQITSFGSVDNIDPLSTSHDDLIMVFGDERDKHQELVLFDQVFTQSNVTFRIDMQLYPAAISYEGVCTIFFSTGEVKTLYVFLPDVNENNFTAIRFKNTKRSNSDVQTIVRAFNVVLIK
ncbi:hypothetical protein SAMN05428949_4525 [Chitinophaga sp. YR627]|uniref:hypothetical protein n=1 Tax=Chitinophaga sp. YR627 TaxID=1881041 RepID=UPI0008E82D35|nr:hypothetical protein [Chitinophaga sp. YR627]SFO22179.1 hypothetical protein SAMN05428949_4525 [Chitinophaga sp. YR627]